jgi:threonine dehydrogenase-like Zn-dependent dehydrogenase
MPTNPIDEKVPQTQYAVQLIAANRLRLNEAKPVVAPGPQQYLCRVEAVGLCLSDMKLLAQFNVHPRKTPILKGISQEVLAEIPSYVPETMPAVPGHEAVVRIVKAGAKTSAFQVGERYVVQADYRTLLTQSSNGAFGYNFEGALQEYALLDERIIVDTAGEKYLLPFSEKQSAAAGVLVEPWACVEASFAARERRKLKTDGNVLVFFEDEVKAAAKLTGVSFEESKRVFSCGMPEKSFNDAPTERMRKISLDELPSFGPYDDIVYFGSRAERVTQLLGLTAGGGLLNLVQCGRRFNLPVRTPLGRIHYNGLRICGTTGNIAAAGYGMIPDSLGPPSGAFRMAVVGAGGPMGTMHVLRTLSLCAVGTEVVASDLDSGRLKILESRAGHLANERGLILKTHNPKNDGLLPESDYFVVAVPAPALVAEAIMRSPISGIVNIFAGIPVNVDGLIDLDRVIGNGVWLFGTSGSSVANLRTVLEQLESGKLDTTKALAAVSGMRGALRGLELVKTQGVPGKIVVYPTLRNEELTSFDELPTKSPATYAAFSSAGGSWTKEVETLFLAEK